MTAGSLGGAPLLPFSPHDPQLLMGGICGPRPVVTVWQARLGMPLAHQAFLAGDVDDVFVATPAASPSPSVLE